MELDLWVNSLQIDEEELFGGLIWRERSGAGFEEASMKIPSKGILSS